MKEDVFIEFCSEKIRYYLLVVVFVLEKDLNTIMFEE